MTGNRVEIKSRDFWIKVVEMLQQNWALIDDHSDGGVIIFFISDGSEVFDKLKFDSFEEAIQALRRNGFSRYLDDKESQKFISPPKYPFFKGNHPNGPIYSSGQFWV